jgi:hypothetical protein
MNSSKHHHARHHHAAPVGEMNLVCYKDLYDPENLYCTMRTSAPYIFWPSPLDNNAPQMPNVPQQPPATKAANVKSNKPNPGLVASTTPIPTPGAAYAPNSTHPALTPNATHPEIAIAANIKSANPVPVSPIPSTVEHFMIKNPLNYPISNAMNHFGNPANYPLMSYIHDPRKYPLSIKTSAAEHFVYSHRKPTTVHAGIGVY